MAKVILTAPRGFVKGKFEPFKSTVDGTIITSRAGLDEHNKRNNVVCIADGYDEATILSGAYGKSAPEELDKDELREDLLESLHIVNQGYKPTTEVQEDD